MKTRRCVAILGMVLILSGGARISAATVRGQLRCNGGSAAASGVAVTLSNPRGTRTGASFTGGDGMYYFNNIAPGTYTLEVWLSKRGASPTVTYQRMVVREPSTDFPRATVNSCYAR